MKYNSLKKNLFNLIFGFLLFFQSDKSFAFDEIDKNKPEAIRIVGSSTVYPFVSIVAEEFAKKNSGKFVTPIVESTGTGGGMSLFCNGNKKNDPDIVNASRRMSSGENEKCVQNKVGDIAEFSIGYDAIVVAVSRQNELFDKISLSERDLFLALSMYIEKDGKVVKNNYEKWSDFNKNLPNVEIKIYGPPTTSGTRESFVELSFFDYCMELTSFISKYPSYSKRKKVCSAIRTDGKFIDVGENDTVIVRKIGFIENAIGIFGFGYYKENMDTVIPIKINDVFPSRQSIIDNKYKLSRPLFVYIKKESIKNKKGAREFTEELIDKETTGKGGYLEDAFLIPFGKYERENYVKSIKEIL